MTLSGKTSTYQVILTTTPAIAFASKTGADINHLNRVTVSDHTRHSGRSITMFGMGMPEIILILAIALIVIGPKKLPDLAKSMGRAFGEFKKATQDLKQAIDVDTDMRDVRSAFDEATRSEATPPPAPEDTADSGSDAGPTETVKDAESAAGSEAQAADAASDASLSGNASATPDASASEDPEPSTTADRDRGPDAG